MQQLREIHVSILTKPCDNLDKSIYQFRQIHLTTYRNPGNNSDKSNNFGKIHKDWRTDWQDKAMIGLGLIKSLPKSFGKQT